MRSYQKNVAKAVHKCRFCQVVRLRTNFVPTGHKNIDARTVHLFSPARMWLGRAGSLCDCGGAGPIHATGCIDFGVHNLIGHQR